MGAAIVLMPQNQAWDVLFDACGAGSQDFMEDREQPPVQKRSLAI
jgi:virulence-associated protein VagC